MKSLFKRWDNTSDGFNLVEVLCTLAILGIIAVGLFSALGTSMKTIEMSDERAIAKNIAESQMEYVKQQAYFLSYAPAPIPAENSSYSAIIEASDISGRDSTIQKITVTIWYQNEVVRILESFKGK